MRPVDQTRFGFPGGNCMQACIASILELELDAVLDFCNTPGDWTAVLDGWLEARGLYCLTFKLDKPGWRPTGLHIMAGRSPRGADDTAVHAVVARGDKIVHDPHPSRAGLLTETETTILIAHDPNEGRYWRDNSKVLGDMLEERTREKLAAGVAEDDLRAEVSRLNAELDAERNP